MVRNEDNTVHKKLQHRVQSTAEHISGLLCVTEKMGHRDSAAESTASASPHTMSSQHQVQLSLRVQGPPDGQKQGRKARRLSGLVRGTKTEKRKNRNP